MDSKLCRKCAKEKPLDEFYRGKGYRDGYRARCKECEGETPSQSAARRLARVYAIRDRNRQFLWTFYAQHPCVDCGETDPVVLEADHLDKALKFKNVSQLVHSTRSLEVIQRELDKCEVVCANCHRRRTASTQGWYDGLDCHR